MNVLSCVVRGGREGRRVPASPEGLKRHTHQFKSLSENLPRLTSRATVTKSTYADWARNPRRRVL
jgi:hypothetical protein